MVLHNDKWKYKAKRSFQKKHNLDKDNNPKKLQDESLQDELIDSQDQEDQEGEGGDADEEEAIEKEKEASDNSWRFFDPEQTTELLRDPEYAAKLENERQIESQKNQYYNGIVNEQLKMSDDLLDMGKLQEKYQVKGRNISIKKMKDEDLLKLKIIDSDDDSDYDSDDKYNGSDRPNEMREFTGEEQENFLKLQKIIEHKKKLEQMRKTISKHKPMSNRNVHEIQTSKESDNYKSLVDKQLREAVITKNSNKFEDLVDNLLGVDLNDDHEPIATVLAPKFDLDTLIPPSKPIKTKSSTSKVKLDLQDDFLDSIL